MNATARSTDDDTKLSQPNHSNHSNRPNPPRTQAELDELEQLEALSKETGLPKEVLELPLIRKEDQHPNKTSKHATLLEQALAQKADDAKFKSYAEVGPDLLRKKYGNWSNAMRTMAADGLNVSQISQALKKPYQHVRNVLSQVPKRVA